MLSFVEYNFVKVLPSSCGACKPAPFESNSGNSFENSLHLPEAYAVDDFLLPQI